MELVCRNPGDFEQFMSELESSGKPCPYRHCFFHLFSTELESSHKLVETQKFISVHGCQLMIMEPWQMEEIAEMWGISKQRIMFMEHRAMEKIQLAVGIDESPF